MARPGVLFRFDLLDAIEQLDPADAGRLFVGAMRYGKLGEMPNFQNPLLSIVWAMLKPSIDADGERYAEKVLQTRYATYARETKKTEQKPLSFEDWKSSIDIARCHSISSDTQYNNNPIQSNNNVNPMQEQVQGQGAAAAPPPLARDSRNMIFLDDGQYKALVADLGESEVARCVSYLSEFCAMRGKPYSDWDAAIRKCSREGWGLSSPSPGSKGNTDFQPSLDRIQKSNERLDAFLAEQGKKAKDWGVKITRL